LTGRHPGGTIRAEGRIRPAKGSWRGIAYNDVDKEFEKQHKQENIMISFVRRTRSYVLARRILYGNLGFVTNKIQNMASRRIGKCLHISTLPKSVFIETSTGCNNNCAFCPQSTRPRKEHYMDNEVFYEVIDNLVESGFDGRLMLSLNNEPLLDTRLEKFISAAREKGFCGKMGIITNGILLSEERASSLFLSGLDFITVNSYSSNGRDLVGKLGEWVSPEYPFDERFPEKKMSVHFRFKNEVLTNRAGNAPNKNDVCLRKSSCFWPFSVLPVTTDGSAILCCNDFYGTTRFGSLTENKLADVWHCEYLRNAREALNKADRKVLDLCSVCDFKGYLNPCPVWYARILRI
jgi:hypothetical protein